MYMLKRQSNQKAYFWLHMILVLIPMSYKDEVIKLLLSNVLYTILNFIKLVSPICLCLNIKLCSISITVEANIMFTNNSTRVDMMMHIVGGPNQNLANHHTLYLTMCKGVNIYISKQLTSLINKSVKQDLSQESANSTKCTNFSRQIV